MVSKYIVNQAMKMSGLVKLTAVMIYLMELTSIALNLQIWKQELVGYILTGNNKKINLLPS